MRAVDLFAGFGGFTAGAEMAGAEVVWAANHWPIAVEVHSANHPNVEHVLQDLQQADWSSLPKYDLLLAAPACQGHSEASQPKRRPYHDAMRSTAWAVVACAEATRPRAILVENVPAFQRWTLFDVWLSALAKLGYKTRVQTILASRCGVPQRRERVIITATLRRAVSVVDLNTPEPAFEQCLDPSASGWRPIDEAGADARERMKAASKRHHRCLVQHVTGHRGILLSEPIRTITTKMSWCLVDGDAYRWLTPRELARGMGFPDSYVLPDTIAPVHLVKGLGNAIPPQVAGTAIRQVMAAA